MEEWKIERKENRILITICAWGNGIKINEGTYRKRGKRLVLIPKTKKEYNEINEYRKGGYRPCIPEVEKKRKKAQK